MKQFIGCTSSVAYYSDFTNIHITNNTNVSIYVVPSKVSIENAVGTLVWSSDHDTIDTFYDATNYEDFYNKDKDVNLNFRLFVNKECVHASQYVKKYLIVFDGDYTLKVHKYVDH